jgi:hypothetical protein
MLLNVPGGQTTAPPPALVLGPVEKNPAGQLINNGLHNTRFHNIVERASI